MECAVVSFGRANHSHLPNLLFETQNGKLTFQIDGPAPTKQMQRTHNDSNVATESGACGIAILIAENHE